MNLTKKKKIKGPFEPNLSFQIVSVDATKDAIRLKAMIREQRVLGSLRTPRTNHKRLLISLYLWSHCDVENQKIGTKKYCGPLIFFFFKKKEA